MRISYNWLKEYLPLELKAQDLANHLLQLGFEVSATSRRGPGFSGVVAGEILAIDKHPNADRLSLCTVTDGKQKLPVVCGAKNIAVGQKVALARVGATLPGGRRISRASIRGVESQGMICSSSELGLAAESSDGILVMDPKTEPGVDAANILGSSDEILDVEITPNRPDCLSHLGLARELSAYFRIPLVPRPAPRLKAPEGKCLEIEVEEPQACPRYIGRVLTNLQVGPSPGWLCAKLEAVGLRPINNVVDVTNFILLDIGQPLHAFDLDRLEGGKIAVRSAEAGETLLALDDKEYELTPECLVIADVNKPAAIAGVMGGLESSVTEKTTRVFLESAHFMPAVVRRTSQILRLRSDSSYRFERGTDIAAVETGSTRATGIILSLCGKNARGSEASDMGSKEAGSAPIVVTARRVNEVLGSDFQEEAVRIALKGISTSLEVHGEELKFFPPSYRSDLQTPWDLAEEAARMLGYENIPSKAGPIPLKASRLLPSQALAWRLRTRLAALGLFEAYNYDFISEKLLKNARLAAEPIARLANPLSDDWTILRPTLLIGLLQNAASNLNRGASAVKLFEIGKAYARLASGLEERGRAAGVLLGPVAETYWKPARTPASDFHDAKGVVSDLLSNIPGIDWLPLKAGGQAIADPLFHPVSALRLVTPKGTLGTVGLIHPQAARNWGLERENAALFELDLEVLCELGPTKTQFKPYSLFPSSKRDLSIVVEQKARYAEVAEVVHDCGIEELKALELVDVFTGKAIPEGKQSLTLRLTFGRDDRTLRDAEVDSAVENILKALKSRLGAVLRA